ncbi:CHC2 zinc finger domain-containing protein [Brevundimonas sp.]|uniref:DUF7146 domain-containing protein n=1 Tax=Brevundimonas sp. TaxID=1871086 RepID=UPI002898802C|nr:CHC2 zinc finger domain-containing protein [Brevundimonas sp.]
MTARDELFVRAVEAADLVAVAGVKLKGPDKDKRGECPLCGGPKGTQRFSVNLGKGVWHCHVCGKGGDVIDLEAAIRGGSLREAAERLVGGVLAPVTPQVLREREERRERQAQVEARSKAFKAMRAGDLWRTAFAAKGSPVEHSLAEVYFRSRGLYGPWLDAALEQLRFQPMAHHSGAGERACGAPAVIGLRMAPNGPTGGVHITYLRPDGRGKSALSPSKRMLGEGSRDGVPGGVWLTSPHGFGPLIVGEGIESTISAAILNGVWPCRMVATLSLEAMQGGWAADKYGRVSVDLPRADLSQRAFVWPFGKEDVPVVIAVDHDMSTITRKVRKPTGGSMQVELDATARARVCGSLAQQQWRAAGAMRVSVIAPAVGRDFNDELRARRASSGWANE